MAWLVYLPGTDRAAGAGQRLAASVAAPVGATEAILAVIGEEPEIVASQESPDPARGRRLYVAHCARCHGMDGGGGEGPRLAVADLQQAADVEALRAIIAGGIPGTPMGQMWMLDDRDVADVASYVWSMGRNDVAADELPGDPLEGEALYASMGCDACHVINGEGGPLGPVLTEIGYLRSLEHLRESLIDPGASLPENPDPLAGSRYLPVTVGTDDGRRVRGLRVNEDTFTIQILDEEGIYHSIRKDGIQLEKHFGESLMPSYADRLNEDGVNALVAYLATLKGES